MKLRMTLATGMAVAALMTLSGCNGGGEEPSPEPTSSATTAEPTSAADELPGDWQDPEAEWVVHFNQDGTFVEDFQGIVDFRVGTYKVDGETVSLIGDDGNTTTGTITGVTIVFRLGTLTRA